MLGLHIVKVGRICQWPEAAADCPAAEREATAPGRKPPMPARSRKLTVEGTLELDPAGRIDMATTYVRVRDVSLIDAPAPIAAEHAIAAISADPGKRLTIPFCIGFEAEQGKAYALEAHLSLSNTPEVRVGDYLTVQSYPVSVEQAPADYRLELKRI
jgi:hypothetical protein